ncbi:MAG: MFS transporter [Methanothrix soehngenii]
MKMAKMDGPSVSISFALLIQRLASPSSLATYRMPRLQELLSKGALRFFQKPLKYPELSAVDCRRNLSCFGVAPVLPLYLQFALVILAVSVQPFVVPLYLEQQLGSLSAVFLFFAAWPLAVLVGLMPCFNLAARNGSYRRVMALGLGYLALYQLLLAGLPPHDFLTSGVLALVYGLHCGLFWLPRHVLVSFAIASHRVGSQTSIMQLIALGVGVIAPITAGAVAERLSFEASFFLAAGFSLLSMLPLF